MARRVLPQPGPPHTSVGRPRGKPPPVTSSRPWMPVGHLAREVGLVSTVDIVLPSCLPAHHHPRSCSLGGPASGGGGRRFPSLAILPCARPPRRVANASNAIRVPVLHETRTRPKTRPTSTWD